MFFGFPDILEGGAKIPVRPEYRHEAHPHPRTFTTKERALRPTRVAE
jgi:hypothetical protein